MKQSTGLLDLLQTDLLVTFLPTGDAIQDAGGDLSRGPEILNTARPDLIGRIYDDFADAGAALLATNTVGANAFCLQRAGLEDRMRDINLAGAKIALASADKGAFVAGAVGPLGLTIDEEWDLATVREAYAGQISALLEGGVHAIQFASFSNPLELAFAIREARSLAGPNLPILAQMFLSESGFCETGESAAEAADSLWKAGANVIGVNGGRSITATVRAAEHLVVASSGKPVAAHPNAGYPEAGEGGRLVYHATPQYMGDAAVRLAKAGVRVVGAFSGATPDMVRATAIALTTFRDRSASLTATVAAPAAPAEKTEAPPKAGGFLESLDGSWPVIAEIDPPPNLAFEGIVESARAVAEAGACAISMADNPLASLKMSNLALGAVIRREVGVHAICHVTCRDHNLLGLQSLLMGMHALNIRAVLALTGDPLAASAGQGKSVFDLNSFTLARLATSMNRGVTYSGAPLKGETDFSVGVAFNSAARNLDAERKRLEKKADEGARFVMTQPVFDPDHARRVLEATCLPGLRVFLGFFPLVSARSALYLHNEVPGITIPEAILSQLTSLPAKEDQEKAGLDSCAELLDSLSADMDGVYLISPHNRPRLLIPLVQQIRALGG